MMWSAGPYRDRGKPEQKWRNDCPICGRAGVTSTEQGVRWHA